MNSLLIVLSICIIIYLVYSNKVESYINFNSGSAISYIKALSNRVSKLEYALHQNKYHNDIDIKIKALDKKYGAAYNYYKTRHEKNKQKADNLINSL